MSVKPASARINSILLYTALIFWSIVTLVPFAYMAASSIKPKSVFFSSPFLPDTPLFQLDPGTADLSMGDITLLPPVDESRIYDIEVGTMYGGVEAGRQAITIGWQTQDADFVIPSEPVVGSPLGRVIPADIDDAPDAGTPIYAVVGGNDSGFAGVAWGLLTDDNFDRLINGVPQDTDGDGMADKRISTGVIRALANSFYYASVTAVLATLGAAMGGYALAKLRFRGRNLVDNTVLAALVIPGALLIAPSYQLLYWLGLLDSYLGLILPGLAPAFGVYLFRQAMIGGVPDEMMEAARIDGCGEIRMFFQMAMPMVRPMIGAFLLITYLGAWNNFIGPQIVLQTPDKFPLAVWISQLRGVYGIDYGLIMAGTLVAITPVLVLFLMLQKEFIAGLTAGAVKG